MTEAYDLDRQAAWEVAAIKRAVRRYQDAALDREPAELPPGRRVLLETVGPVSAELEKRLDDALVTKPGPQQSWQAPLLLFEPDVAAFIAVSVALKAPVLASSRVGNPLATYGRRVCAVLRDQADHDQWIARTAKEAETDPAAKRLLDRWRFRNPQKDRRSWTRFAGRIEGARSSKWSDDVRTDVGAALASTLAEAAPAWFELGRVGGGPKRNWPTCLLLTPMAVERMADVEARSEVARPVLLPMLIPPNPWRYVDRPNMETPQ